ncbi:hypothetical protein TcWFU_007901 [Taenia crassiceps]|uniref:Uncharacterized protein n=1 Tax=Taenia crassiceps TaxID=6207 RepID=A0ABR4Q3M8_9CEST
MDLHRNCASQSIPRWCPALPPSPQVPHYKVSKEPRRLLWTGCSTHHPSLLPRCLNEKLPPHPTTKMALFPSFSHLLGWSGHEPSTFLNSKKLGSRECKTRALFFSPFRLQALA